MEGGLNPPQQKPLKPCPKWEKDLLVLDTRKSVLVNLCPWATLWNWNTLVFCVLPCRPRLSAAAGTTKWLHSGWQQHQIWQYHCFWLLPAICPSRLCYSHMPIEWNVGRRPTIVHTWVPEGLGEPKLGRLAFSGMESSLECAILLLVMHLQHKQFRYYLDY